MIDIKENIHHSTDGNRDRKQDFLQSYKGDPDYDVIESLLTDLSNDKQIDPLLLQQHFPSVIREYQTSGFLHVPGVVRKTIVDRASALKMEDEQDIDTTEQDIDISKERINKKYNDLKSNLSILQNTYPQYTISQEYIDTNLSLFDGTIFSDIDQQITILTYKYILEQIVADRKQTKTPLTSYERTLITQFNNFCIDTGIKTHIDLPSHTESINSMRDVINDPQIGKNLYNQKDSIRTFIDQTKIPKLKMKNIPFAQHIMELYPDAIDNIFVQLDMRKPSDFNPKQLIKNNRLDTKYLESFPLNDETIRAFEQMIEKYSKEAQKDIEHRSTLAINQHAFGVCIQTIANYFDTVTLNLEDFASDTKLGSESFLIQDDVLTINGSIHGKSLTILYNLTTGEIQSQDVIVANTGIVYVGDSDNQKETLRFRGPVFDKMQKKSTRYVNKNIKDHIDGGTIEQVDASLRKGLHRRVPIQLDAVLGREVMEHTIEKNLATKQLQELLKLGVPDQGAWSEHLHPEIWQLYTIFDKSMDWYTSDDLRRLRTILVRLQNIIIPIAQTDSTTQSNNTDPLWIFLFNHEKLEQDRNLRSDHNSFYKFFSAHTRNTHDLYLRDVLDLHALERTLQTYKDDGKNIKTAEIVELYAWYEKSTNDPDKRLEEQLG